MQKTIHIPQIQGGIDIQYLIGENAKDNFRIIDLAKSSDIWFHVYEKSSCHIIAVLPSGVALHKKEIQYIVKQGAVLCKQHSRYASDKKVTIIYTTIDQVIKTNIPGMVETRYVKNIVI
jgi:predicted ribosome quality control (RQC) complex YloA/Tae2 family protein